MLALVPIIVLSTGCETVNRQIESVQQRSETGAVIIQSHDRYSSYLGLKTRTVRQYWYCKNVGGELECNKTCDKSPHCGEVESPGKMHALATTAAAETKMPAASKSGGDVSSESNQSTDGETNEDDSTSEDQTEKTESNSNGKKQ